LANSSAPVRVSGIAFAVLFQIFWLTKNTTYGKGGYSIELASFKFRGFFEIDSAIRKIVERMMERGNKSSGSAIDGPRVQVGDSEF
jgi:hypothetical protein